jgi:hypothetical protein
MKQQICILLRKAEQSGLERSRCQPALLTKLRRLRNPLIIRFVTTVSGDSVRGPQISAPT